MTPRHLDSLRSLFSSLCEDSMTSQELAGLEDKLRDDPAALSEFVAYLDLHAALDWEFSRKESVRPGKSEETEAEEDQNDPGIFQHDDTIARATDTMPLPARRAAWFSKHISRDSIVITAVLFLAVGLVLGRLYMSNGTDDGTRKTAEKPAPAAKHVAILNGESEVTWIEGQRTKAHDPRLWPGEKLVIDGGLIDLKYLTGARVVIEGPAEFVVGGTEAQGKEIARSSSPHPSRLTPQSSANSGYLARGKLVARCKTKASKGFTIHTPHAQVVDLGTEFGVDVKLGGAIRLLVFEGKVDAVPQRDGSWASRTLVANEAMTIDRDSTEVPVQSATLLAEFSRARSWSPKTNLLANAGFESATKIPHGWPKKPARWTGDVSRIVRSEQGITPASGMHMLRFVETLGGSKHDGVGCNERQLIDLRSRRDQIQAGGVVATLSATFNRVAKDERTDDAFVLEIYAPKRIPSKGEFVGSPLVRQTFTTDADPSTWQAVSVQAALPNSTRFLLVDIAALENRYNNQQPPEFDGHYMDDVRLTLDSTED